MQQQIFYCTSPTGKVNGKGWVYIESDRWFDARKVAHTLFGTDQVNFKIVEERPGLGVHLGNGYTLKWEGSPMDARNQPELKVVQWPSPEKHDAPPAVPDPVGEAPPKHQAQNGQQPSTRSVLPRKGKAPRAR